MTEGGAVEPVWTAAGLSPVLSPIRARSPDYLTAPDP